MRYPHIMQYDMKDCGAACLSMVSEFYGAKYSIASLRNLIKVDNHGSNVYGIVNGAKQIHFNAEALEGTYDELTEGISDGSIKLPCIARIINENHFMHYIVIYRIKDDILYIGDPAKVHNTKISLQSFLEKWQNQIITFEPDSQFKRVNNRKGMLSKYFKYIWKQKRRFFIVIAISLILSVITVLSSGLFKYILDDSSNYDAQIHSYQLESNNDITVHEKSSKEIAQEEADHEELEHEETDHEASEHEEIIHEKNENSQNGILDSYETGMNNLIKYLSANIHLLSISIILLYVMGALIRLLRGYLLSVASRDIETPMTLDYFRHMIRLPIDFFGTRQTGEIMSRFSDTSTIRNAISGATLTVAIDTVSAIITGVSMLIISVPLFLITLVILALYAIITICYRKPLKNINHETLESGAQVDSYIKESIDGVELIKSYQLEQTVFEKTASLFKKLMKKTVHGSVIGLSLDALVTTISSIGTVAILWVGTVLVTHNVIDFGEVFAFYYLMGNFLSPMASLIDLQPTLQTAMVAAERLEDVVSVEIEKVEGEDTDYNLKGDIDFVHVDFRYGFRELVLKHLNISIKQGQNVALVGESGCGKTTIAKLLMSFYQPESGEIRINGYNIAEIPPKAVRDRIAYVPQNSFFFTDTIKNNLKFGNEDVTDEEIKELCVQCSADKFIMDLPNGYETVLEENATNLSSGQKQRLAIVRALLKKPEILIIDEATGNLDTITESNIINTIDNATQDITCLLIAHRLNTIRNCDNIFVMKDGIIVEQGEHDELMANGGMYRDYYNAVM